MNEHQNTEKQEALDRKGFYIDVGAEIRERRKLLGITQEELAERIGKSPMHLRNLENARRQSMLHVYVDIAKVLGCTLNDLLSGYFSRDKEIMSDIQCLIVSASDKELALTYSIIQQDIRALQSTKPGSPDRKAFTRNSE